jgi:methylmalonyl-CoA mutase cobalamin-binding subunit
MNKIPNRKAICDVLLKEAETDKDIVVLCSDSRGSASLAPAIVWQCSRASEICERIKTNVMIDPDREQKKNGGVAEIIRQKTGMHLSPYFPLISVPGAHCQSWTGIMSLHLHSYFL